MSFVRNYTVSVSNDQRYSVGSSPSLFPNNNRGSPKILSMTECSEAFCG